MIGHTLCQLSTNRTRRPIAPQECSMMIQVVSKSSSEPRNVWELNHSQGSFPIVVNGFWESDFFKIQKHIRFRVSGGK